jgi:hypothetical protein
MEDMEDSDLKLQKEVQPIANTRRQALAIPVLVKCGHENAAFAIALVKLRLTFYRMKVRCHLLVAPSILKAVVVCCRQNSNLGAND